MKAKSWLVCLVASAVLACPIPAGAAAASPAAKRLPAPKKLIITPADTTIEKGEKLQLSAVPSPAGSNPAVYWYSSDRRIASVTGGGLVTARKEGKVRIKARSKVKSSVYTIRTFRIVDTKTVKSVAVVNDETALLPGGTMTLVAQVLPVTAPQQVTWSSDSPLVAGVTPEGLVTANQPGTATMTATAVGGKQAKQRVVVLEDRPVSELPSQITSVAMIDENLERMDDVLRCATDEVDRLRASGAISKSETDKRKVILLNAFRMARFPWMSGRAVKYWSGNYWYQANVVYYGLPYTQLKRTFNVARALRIGAFRLLGSDAHYTANLSNVSYPGNDCSAFVSMSIWGVNSSHSFQRSREIKRDSAYRTIASSSNLLGYQKLRPGDLLVKDGHVAMFLYYTNSFHSRLMIIQQGGRPALNTVGCDIKPLNSYSPGTGYIGRRKSTFA
jgi:hypothetical protein